MSLDERRLPDFQSLLSSIYALDIVVKGTHSPKALLNFDFRSIELLRAEQIPNRVAMPSAVRSKGS
jgi:hypothetical protein